MTKEQCSLQPNYYGSSCDFQDLQSAVQQLTTKSDAQFEELKNEKWFHRIFNMVVCPRKNNIRMAEQITSLAQAQGILIEILVRLADQDAKIAGMVMQSQSDIRALAQNSAYLQERLYLLEDKSYGIKENENLKDLNSQQRNILSGCLNDASKLYAMPSNEQRLYANELLNYLNADAQVANLEDALDDLEDNAKRKILSCVITYMYLYDHTAESMEQDEQEDFIDLFDLGRKTIKSLKQQTVDTYRLRGVDGCIDRYITAPIEITEETPFEVELPEPKAAEGASEAQAEENGEEAIDTNAPREKLVLSGSIQNNGETVYKNKDIHFSSAIMNCKGTVKFINCTIHYNEDGGSHIYLGNETKLYIEASTIVCDGIGDKTRFFIDEEHEQLKSASCTIKNSQFINCSNFISSYFETVTFENNKSYGFCLGLLVLKIQKEAKICNNKFYISEKPIFEVENIYNFAVHDLIHFSCVENYSKIFIDGNVFIGSPNMETKTYLQEKGIGVIGGAETTGYAQNGIKNSFVSNCTFVRISNCIKMVNAVNNCIFDKCKNAVIGCGIRATGNLFTNCEEAFSGLYAHAGVSDCQFVQCKGEKLITADSYSSISIEDCEFLNIRLSEDGSWYKERSMILFGIKSQNSVKRCIFNGICISRNNNCGYLDEKNKGYIISTDNNEKLNYPSTTVKECNFINCASEHGDIIYESSFYKPLFGKMQRYTIIALSNNFGLNNIGSPSNFVEASNITLKETDSNGNRIGSTFSLEWNDSPYSTNS